jgi:perosamine synthetase
MVSYIFGVQYNIDEICEFCKERNIVVIEDIAEAFKGLSYTGHPKAEMSFLSFGGIKKCTSFGGCLCFVRNKQLYIELEKRNTLLPVYPSFSHFKKLLKIIFPYLVLNNVCGNWSFKTACNVFHFDYKEFVVNLMR